MEKIEMRRLVACAAVLALPALGGCNQTQEDRAAEQAASAIHKGNQALKDITSKAQDGAEKAASAAREAAHKAAPVISDATVTAKVKTALLADKDVSAMAIDVDTEGGIVTLSGRLPDAAQANRAVEIARNIEGVKSVENRLSVQSKG